MTVVALACAGDSGPMETATADDTLPCTVDAAALVVVDELLPANLFPAQDVVPGWVLLGDCEAVINSIQPLIVPTLVYVPC